MGCPVKPHPICCGNWYFPKFLLSDGSLTLMFMASLIFLVTPYPLLWSIWSLLGVMWNGYGGYGDLRCSLSLSQNNLPDSSMYSPGQLMCGHLHLYMTPCFWGSLSLSLGVKRRGFNGVTPFAVHQDPQAVTGPFELLPKSVYVWYCYGDIFAFDPLLLVLFGWLLVVVCPLWMLCLWLNLFCQLLRAHCGKLQAVGLS